VTERSTEPGQLDSGLVNQANPVDRISDSTASISGTYDSVRQVSAEEMARGVLISQEGESWNDLSRRLFGSEDRARELWMMNRDRYSGGLESRLVAGKLVRIPGVKKGSLLNGDTSRIASK
jgi:hypothetical protein